MNRRKFSKSIGLFSIASFSGLLSMKNLPKKPPVFLIISGWQTVNIGDIAHTPGLLALIDHFFPEAHYYLWPRDIEGHGVEDMLKKNFPKLKILKTNKPGVEVNEPTEEMKTVFDACDILLHGSGPHILELFKLKLWKSYTNKPYGICGVTEQKLYPELEEIIKHSAFFFTRETASLNIIRKFTGESVKTDFFPDATFYIQLHNEEKALALLHQLGLSEGEFICIIPRLRYTPYYKIHDYIQWNEDKIKEVNTTNDRYKEIDHKKLRDVMIKWVRQTGKKVLICPEMTYQTEIMDELLIDPLPEDVKDKVYKKGDYWITDEAASVYKRAFAVISMECHSPIIALANHTPGFYVRQKEDTIKGQMYYDIGLSEWVFEIDQTDGNTIYSELEKILKNEQYAKDKISHAYRIIHTQYTKAFSVIKELFLPEKDA